MRNVMPLDLADTGISLADLEAVGRHHEAQQCASALDCLTLLHAAPVNYREKRQLAMINRRLTHLVRFLRIVSGVKERRRAESRVRFQARTGMFTPSEYRRPLAELIKLLRGLSGTRGYLDGRWVVAPARQLRLARRDARRDVRRQRRVNHLAKRTVVYRAFFMMMRVLSGTMVRGAHGKLGWACLCGARKRFDECHGVLSGEAGMLLELAALSDRRGQSLESGPSP